MNLASRIHQHLHQPKSSGDSVTSHDAEHDDAAPHSRPPLWVRRYDGLVRIVSLGRVTKLHDATLDLVGFQAGDALLDIGCGTGDLVLQADGRAKGHGTFVGLDVEPAMVAQARTKAVQARSVASFAEADITAVPRPDDSFDVITSSLMFHHLTPEQQADGLVELRRVLRPGGRLAIVDINSAKPSLVSRLPGHRDLEEIDPVQERVARQLSEAGFDDVTAGAHPLQALSYTVGSKR